MSTIHTFVACAFKDDFNLNELTDDWNNNNITVDSNNTKAKCVLGGGYVFAYKYGVLVFVDVNPLERQVITNEIRNLFKIPQKDGITTEDFKVEENDAEKSRVEFSKLVLDKLTSERVAIISLVVAQSAAMTYYEDVVSNVKNTTYNLIVELKNTGKIKITPRRLNRIIGDAMLMKHEVVGVLHLLDKPDIMWEDSLMDRLYNDICSSFDLKDRFQALEYKLQMIQDDIEVIMGVVRDSRLYKAELVIIGLFTIDIVIIIGQIILALL